MWSNEAMSITDIREIEGVLFWVERPPIIFLLLLSRFSYFLPSTIAILTASNLIHLSLFIDQSKTLLLPNEPQLESVIFWVERVAGGVAALYYWTGWECYWYLAIGLFALTNLTAFLSFIVPEETDEKSGEKKVTSNQEKNFNQEGLLREIKRLRNETHENKENCLKLEKEKRDLLSKLIVATESVKQYQVIEKYFADDRCKWDVEKKKLCADIESSERLKQIVQEYKDKCNNLEKEKQNLLYLISKLDGATSSLEFIEYYQEIENNLGKNDEEKEDLSTEFDASKACSKIKSDEFEAVNAPLEEDYRKWYEDVVKEYEKEKQSLSAELDDTKSSLQIKSNELESVGASLEDYQKRYEDVVKVYDKEGRALLADLDDTKASLQIKSEELKAVNASLEHYQKRYEDVVNIYVEESQNLSAELDDTKAALQIKSDELEAVNASLEHYQKKYEDSVEDYQEEKQLLYAELVATKASLRIKSDEVEAANALLENYQKMYENAVKDYEEKCVKWDEERTDLSAKISKSNSWNEYYQSTTNDYKSLCNISAKRHEVAVNDYEEKIKRFEEEKNDLVSELSAAKEACQQYRSYFQDFTLTPK